MIRPPKQVEGTESVFRFISREVLELSKHGRIYCYKYGVRDKRKKKISFVYFGSKKKKIDNIEFLIIYSADLKKSKIFLITPGIEHQKDFNKMLASAAVGLTKLKRNLRRKQNEAYDDVFEDNHEEDDYEDDRYEQGYKDDIRYSSTSTTDNTKNILLLNLLVPFTTGAIALLFFLYYYFRKAIKLLDEREANVVQQQIMNDLYKISKNDEQAFAEYTNLIKSVESVIKTNRNGLVVCGPPGTGKSFVVGRTLWKLGLKYGEDFIILKGSSTNLSAVYETLYRYRKKTIVLDDFDIVLNNPQIVDLLKSATDSYKKRILSLPREKTITSDKGKDTYAPDKFVFEGKVIIITNKEPKSVNKALISRMGWVEVKFKVDTMLRIIKKMMKYINPDVPIKIKKEIFDFLVEQKTKNENVEISMRTFVIGIGLRIADPQNWKVQYKTLIVK